MEGHGFALPRTPAMNEYRVVSCELLELARLRLRRCAIFEDTRMRSKVFGVFCELLAPSAICLRDRHAWLINRQKRALGYGKQNLKEPSASYDQTAAKTSTREGGNPARTAIHFIVAAPLGQGRIQRRPLRYRQDTIALHRRPKSEPESNRICREIFQESRRSAKSQPELPYFFYRRG